MNDEHQITQPQQARLGGKWDNPLGVGTNIPGTVEERPDDSEFGQQVYDHFADQQSVDFGAPRVRLKWYTPQGDALVAHMARVSNTKAKLDDPAEKLIGYLIRNHHWSPFEMVNLCLEIHTERDISAQILRHSKEFRFQEFSTRYAEVEDLRWATECRFQDLKNRQGSFTVEDILDNARVSVSTDPALAGADVGATVAIINGYPVDETASYFDAVVNETRTRSLEAYRELLERGVAKECARRVLPIGLCPTVMYINSNLRGWIHYLAERTKPGVQKEHREIALAVEPHFAACFPLVWQAVLAYRAELERRDWKVEQYDQIYSLFSAHFEKNGGSGDVVDSVVDLVKELLA